MDITLTGDAVAQIVTPKTLGELEVNNNTSFIVTQSVFVRLRTFIHGGKDQHKSCTAHHGESLLCPCLRTTCNFFGYFSGLGNFASPSSNEHGSWWASKIRSFD